MIVLVDTTLWSLALRRRPGDLGSSERRLVESWVSLVRSGEAVLIGPIRQEILSGIRDEKTFERIRQTLGAFRYISIEPADYDHAARLYNRCRAEGIAGTAIDLLICAVALRSDVPIFTTDGDFQRFQRHLGVRLFVP
ncbi:MAG: PIN domain-containing protein [Holophagales bacterium]|nr:PIN domain-containing protein [Holophagales bacterium]